MDPLKSTILYELNIFNSHKIKMFLLCLKKKWTLVSSSTLLYVFEKVV